MAKRPNRRWMASARKADSLWEANLRDGPFIDYEYHTDRIPYTVEHMYEPDFVVGDVIIEAKGRFRETSEASKYVHVRTHLPEGKELIFLFYKADNPMPGARPRKSKGGTKFTHGEWGTKSGFKWFENPAHLRAFVETGEYRRGGEIIE